MKYDAFRRIRNAMRRQAIEEMEREHYIHYALERDIVWLLAAGDDYGFTVGWPYHRVMRFDPYWMN